MRKKIMMVITLCLMALIAPLQSFTAQEDISPSSYSDFSVEAEIPDNQINKTVSYFDILASSDQTLIVKVSNHGSEDMVIHAELNQATTEYNGEILYSAGKSNLTDTAIDLKSFASILENNIPIAANSSASVVIQLQDIPKFEGVILGGLRFKATTRTQEDAASKDQISIQSEIAYVIGLKIQTTEAVLPTLLTFDTIGSQLTNGRPSIVAGILNSEPILMKDVKIDSTLYKSSKQEPLATINLSNRSIAPTSTLPLLYDLGTKKLENGKYFSHIRIEHEDVVWEWDEEFEISNASEINDAALIVKNPISKMYYVIIAIIGCILLLFLLLFFLLFKQKRRNDEEV